MLVLVQLRACRGQTGAGRSVGARSGLVSIHHWRTKTTRTFSPLWWLRLGRERDGGRV